jgi:hypothetical protein
MRTRRTLAVLTLLTVTALGLGCATTGWQPSFEQSSYKLIIASETHQAAQSGPAGSQLSESAVQEEVDRLLGLKPKTPVPARVLLYQVPSTGRSNVASPLKVLELREATGQQMRKALQATGVFLSVDFLPEILLPSGAPADLKTVRIAAARAQADAILVYSTEAGYERKPNDWALLYATLIGAFIAPGTDQTSMAVSKAVLLDVPTGYIYFVTEDYGSESVRGPVAALDAEELEYGTRLKSLGELSTDVAGRVAALRGPQ